MANNNGIKVEKGTFEYKGKTYDEYYISGNVRGRDVKIKLAPPDKNDKGGATQIESLKNNSGLLPCFSLFCQRLHYYRVRVLSFLCQGHNDRRQ